jgi:hypothetical protein
LVEQPGYDAALFSRLVHDFRSDLGSRIQRDTHAAQVVLRKVLDDSEVP